MKTLSAEDAAKELPPSGNVLIVRQPDAGRIIESEVPREEIFEELRASSEIRWSGANMKEKGFGVVFRDGHGGWTFVQTAKQGIVP